MEKSVFIDQDVAGLLLSVIKDARKYVIVVTPYVDLWQHVENAIELAIKNKVELTFVIRPNLRPNEENTKSLTWLIEHRVKVSVLENLHAKIYLNENTTVISSMNLTESSTNKSLEVAMIVKDRQDAQAIRSYVNDGLLKSAVSLEEAASKWEWIARSTFGDPTHYQVVAGVCIRCGRQIPLDQSKPLCEDHYDTWAEYENENYQENYCHICGKPSDVTYAKPLCQSCYKKFG